MGFRAESEHYCCNLVSDFHHPEAKVNRISCRRDPIITLLNELAKAICEDPHISRQYPVFHYLGSNEKLNDNNEVLKYRLFL